MHSCSEYRYKIYMTSHSHSMYLIVKLVHIICVFMSILKLLYQLLLTMRTVCSKLKISLTFQDKVKEIYNTAQRYTFSPISTEFLGRPRSLQKLDENSPKNSHCPQEKVYRKKKNIVSRDVYLRG